MMARNYNIGNLPVLQQGTQAPFISAEHSSSVTPALYGAPNNTPAGQTANLYNVTIAEHQAEINAPGVHIQVHNVAIRAETSRANVSHNANVPLRATANNQPQLSSPVGHPMVPSSQHASAPASGARPPQGIPRSPLQITGGERGVVPYSPLSAQPQGGAEPAVVRLERTGDVERTAGEINVQMVKAKTDDLTVGAVRREVLVEGERKVVRQEIEVTDDGQVRLREYIHTERVFYRRIFEIMFIAALNEPEDPEEPKFNEKCIDCCCQAFSCSNALKSLFGRRNPQAENKTSAIKKIELMTPILRRGRSRGWVMHTEMIFPLVKNTFRNIWVGSELLMVVVALGLSIASFSLGKNRVFNILHLVLTIIGSILAVVDGIILLCQCCGKCHCENTSGEAESNSDAESPGGIEHAAPSHNGKCKRCAEKCKGLFDIGRMILAELFFYPLLICDIFEVITGEAYRFSSVEDGISFFLFVISLGLVLFYVYIVRIIILIVANYHSQKHRQSTDNDENVDPTIRKSALFFQIYFVIHVFGQMVAQILMIITIGIGIHEENKQSSNGSISVSGNLWYMIVAGYVIPVFGLFTFFVVTYYWVQEFPIGICVDILSILQQPGIDEVLEMKKTKAEGGDRLNRINKYIHFSELKKQFKNLRSTPFFYKFGYPFGSPQMVIASLFFAGFQLGFVINASQSLGGEWAVFYVPAGIIGYLANIYVFTVAAFWSVVIIGVIVAVATVLAMAIFCCLMISCLSGSSNNNNNYRR